MFIKNGYKSRFERCVKSMLEDLKLPVLQQRRLDVLFIVTPIVGSVIMFYVLL